MLPERLVTIKRLASPELAEADLGRLEKAGLDAYLGGTYYRYHGSVWLQVPESQVSKAKAVLESEAAEPFELPLTEPGVQIAVCPDCGSADAYRVPPYALGVLVTSALLALVATILGKKDIGFAVLMIGWVIAIGLSRHTGKYRCRRCQREWKPS